MEKISDRREIIEHDPLFVMRALDATHNYTIPEGEEPVMRPYLSLIDIEIGR